MRIRAALSIGLLVLVTAAARAGDETANQVWVVGTRSTGQSSSADGDLDRFDYRRFDAGNRQWTVAEAEAFFDTLDADLPITLFVHGDRSSHQQALSTGWMTYRWVDCHSGGRPFRFVIWSWPADRVLRRGRLDSRLKACRSDLQSYYLAELLDAVDPAVPVNLIGHSYGARIITGAMQILGGGTVAGRGLQATEPSPERAGLRAILVAAAMDSDWLLPGRRYGRALGPLDRLLLTWNPRDPGLKWYPLLYGLGGPRALGSTGPACPARLGAEREKIETVCLARSVGRHHDWTRYMTAPELASRVGSYSFPEHTALQPVAEESR